jgi:hypothetical protein
VQKPLIVVGRCIQIVKILLVVFVILQGMKIVCGLITHPLVLIIHAPLLGEGVCMLGLFHVWQPVNAVVFGPAIQGFMTYEHRKKSQLGVVHNNFCKEERWNRKSLW